MPAPCTVRRGLVAAMTVAVLAVTVAPAAAGPQQDPLNATKSALLCEPDGSVLRPTQACAIYDPATETYSNPYTPNGDSPGLLGLGVLGIL